MNTFIQTAAREEKGFTLVELAVVMIIIGLLIGGVLKGQEMISNAQITSTIAQAKAYEAATTTFRDQYASVPGDMAVAADTRIPNCGAVCAQAGDGSGTIGNDPGAAHADLTNENGAAWAQLVAADLISGVDQTSAVGAAPAAGISIPSASVTGSSWQIGYTNDGTLTTGVAAGRAGHYLLLDNSLDAAAAVGTASLTPGQAARIDRKLDDGNSSTGTVIGMGADAAATDCSNGGVYNEAEQGNLCGLYVRIQG